MAHIIKLNVGGSLFQTSKSTLTKLDGKFKTMLETEIPVDKDESGAIFIDRDPKHFRVILNLMRDGEVALPEAPVDVTEIQKEADYYLLDGLVELCKLKPEAQKMPYSETYEGMARTVASSTKKVLCIVYYGYQLRKYYEECFIKAVRRYGDKVDFRFGERARAITKFIIHNKKTHRIFDGYADRSFDDFIKKYIPDIDDY